MKINKNIVVYVFIFITCFDLINAAIIQTSSTLGNGQTLYAGEYLSSGNDYYAVMQYDGNFVLYSTMNWVPDNAVWSTHTDGDGTPNHKIVMQDDGNLVIYDTYGRPTWASRTDTVGTKPHKLVLQDDRNLVIYDGNGRPTWATGTNV